MILKVGDKAPGFSGPNQNGKEISLADFAGRKLVLYFYPKDDTPGCTTEACNFRDAYEDLYDRGLSVVGVSFDSVKSHEKFANKFSLPFDLLADEKKEVIEAYGVWGEKNMYGRKYMGTLRKTFLIDEQGIISAIIEKVKNKEASKQIIDLL